MKKAVVTGTTGGIGEVLAQSLLTAGFQVHELSRKKRLPDTHWTFCDLRQLEALQFPSKQDTFVHCAHDFSVRNWMEMRRVNVDGSIELFTAALSAGCRNLIFISSIAAFEGAKSNYGRGKKMVEDFVLQHGGICIRPGLVYGVQTGLVERLRQQMVSRTFIPLIDGGRTPVYPVSVHEVCRGIVQILNQPEKYSGVPTVVAAKEPISFRDMLDRLAGVPRGFRVFVPVPWRVVWLGLRLAESFGLRLPFTSDSVIGLRFQCPDPYLNTLTVNGLHVKNLLTMNEGTHGT